MGNSMLPAYSANDRIIAVNTLFFSLHKSDVVIFYEKSRKLLLLKRITNLKANMYFLEGDNKQETTDSNQFGWVEKKYILGKVIYPKKQYNH